jgi:multimeric flavodoxin WrbA
MADKDVEPRREMPDPKLTRAEFERRFRGQFIDPAFDNLGAELASIAAAAWDGYDNGRKSPRTRRAGTEFAEPEYELATDWLEARAAVAAAQRRHDDRSAPDHFLLINGATRSEHTCPGESSKSYRLVKIACEVIQAVPNTTVQILDLSRVASEYGRQIHPCKTCFSTAAPLCHWPCSCYPNYSLGQTHDWMNEIYPMWVAAHGILIVTPVNWYHGSSPLKLMIDRLVCADGGNPDPTRTCGKQAKRAKQIELRGWDYPKHLRGRLFACFVHGDAEGAGKARSALCDWLSSMELTAAGHAAALDRYIGYWQPYATSHAALDADSAVQAEVRSTAQILLKAVSDLRDGRRADVNNEPNVPRQK